MKERADIVLVKRGFVNSVDMAKRLIMEGVVYIDNFRVDTAGEKIKVESNIIVKKNLSGYVSRGGFKLEKAMELYPIVLENKICMDIGSSTGGFTDCMLQNGSSKVYAVDVGYGQLDWKLRSDPRVVVMERTNIRYVDKESLGEDIDFISIDVSFISLDLVLPKAFELLGKEGELIALIKPQFEVEKEKVGPKGIITDALVHVDSIEKVYDLSKKLNFGVLGLTYSPIKGATGNIEFLIYLKKNSEDLIEREDIVYTVEKAHLDLA